MSINRKPINLIRNYLIFSLSLIIISGCNHSKKNIADKILFNGKIYTMNDSTPIVEALAIKDGKILALGSNDMIKQMVGNKTKLVDLEGKMATPGLVEGHGHFMGLGMNELNLDLLNVKSYDELVSKVKEAVNNSKPGEWIVGRGWHQSKWDNSNEEMINGFPTHKKLTVVSPNNPVYLSHASGHAGLANQKAMEIAGVQILSKESMSEKIEIEGGEIVRDENGNPTGIFNERAQSLIRDKIPEITKEKTDKAFDLAIKACWRNGITSFHDAGVDRETLSLYETNKSKGKLGIRMYAMITGWDKDLINEWYKKGPMIDTIDYLLNIRSIKLNCDGALGSRGAWLLEPYSDRNNHYGHETLPMDFVLETAKKGLEYGFQVCSHAIGDRANREILDRYEMAFNELDKPIDARYRIEHAQHIHPDDIPRFGKLGVIPAIQAIHLSSDRPWAINRLGEKRIVEGAYMWKELMKYGATIVNGTDVPVEPIDPIASFYASVTRKTLNGKPNQGFESKQKMTRLEALKSYTINAAYASFMEDQLGTLEKGKFADITVFDKNLMDMDENEILKTRVCMTIMNGEIVFKK